MKAIEFIARDVYKLGIVCIVVIAILVSLTVTISQIHNHPGSKLVIKLWPPSAEFSSAPTGPTLDIPQESQATKGSTIGDVTLYCECITTTCPVFVARTITTEVHVGTPGCETGCEVCNLVNNWRRVPSKPNLKIEFTMSGQNNEVFTIIVDLYPLQEPYAAAFQFLFHRYERRVGELEARRSHRWKAVTIPSSGVAVTAGPLDPHNTLLLEQITALPGKVYRATFQGRYTIDGSAQASCGISHDKGLAVGTAGVVDMKSPSKGIGVWGTCLSTATIYFPPTSSSHKTQPVQLNLQARAWKVGDNLKAHDGVLVIEEFDDFPLEFQSSETAPATVSLERGSF